MGKKSFEIDFYCFKAGKFPNTGIFLIFFHFMFSFIVFYCLLGNPVFHADRPGLLLPIQNDEEAKVMIMISSKFACCKI
jgi:hypothetical protein